MSLKILNFFHQCLIFIDFFLCPIILVVDYSTYKEMYTPVYPIIIPLVTVTSWTFLSLTISVFSMLDRILLNNDRYIPYLFILSFAILFLHSLPLIFLLLKNKYMPIVLMILCYTYTYLFMSAYLLIRYHSRIKNATSIIYTNLPDIMIRV